MCCPGGFLRYVNGDLILTFRCLSANAGIRDLVGVLFGASTVFDERHGGMLVGQMSESAGNVDGQTAIGVETKEPDARDASIVHDVSTNVCFEEP